MKDECCQGYGEPPVEEAGMNDNCAASTPVQERGDEEPKKKLVFEEILPEATPEEPLSNFDLLLTHLSPLELARMTVKLILDNNAEHYYCTTSGQLFPMTDSGLESAVAYETQYWESAASVGEQ